jgi:flagellin-specific chaperone FliS
MVRVYIGRKDEYRQNELPMKTPHEMIIVMFQRSAFALTFETEEILGYRSGPQG